MKYFCCALYHAERRELDFAVFFARLSGYDKSGELLKLCFEQISECDILKAKACNYGIKKWYKHAAKYFAQALEINAQDETARLGLINTAGKGFIL